MADDLSALDLDQLVSQAKPGTGSWVDPEAKRLREIEAERKKEVSPIQKQMTDDLQSDRADTDKQYKEFIESGNIQPWTQKPVQRDPLELFGSVGSIFAIAASAFTHTPIINALNGSAAAMNAIMARDADNYRTAFEAWKENTKIALDRERILHDKYQAAMERRKTNLTESEAMIRAISLEHGDQATEVMSEAGLYEKRDNLWLSRQNSARAWAEAAPRIREQGEKWQAYLDLEKARKSGNPDQISAAQQRIRDLQDAFSPFRAPTEAMSKAQQISIARDEFIRANNREPTSDEMLGIIQKVETAFKAPSAGGGGVGAVRADAIRKQIAEKEQELGRKVTGKEEANIVNDVMKGGITGNLKERLQSRADQFSYSLDKIDASMGVLDKYVLAAGLPGRAGRLAERVRDIFGSNDTDRVQFMRNIEYLQANAPRLLVDTQGRPLSKEADKIMDIVAGLSAGDTTANTKRALNDLKDLYTQMQRDVTARMEGGETSGTLRESPGIKPSGTEAAPAKAQPWLDAPEVQ